ncbi:hypothetical protein COY23_00870 [bacterium (Candidatus Torokbacteria) CG_4_10_14_0_2_um_filter_35_8]|nr:MAG: hypothetical protein COY23_00870 [bacterium (Candidatus Torokbacteria) CG_4_10_14_0_2_um_filter_35_8]
MGKSFQRTTLSVITLCLCLLLLSGSKGCRFFQVPSTPEDSKVYENKEYGYSFVYPKELNLSVKDEDTNNTKFWKPEEFDKLNSGEEITYPEFILAVEDNPNGLDINSWLEEENSRVGITNLDQKKSFNTNEGIKGYKVLEEGSPDHFNYYFSHNNKVYIFSTPNEEYEGIFKTMSFHNKLSLSSIIHL